MAGGKLSIINLRHPIVTQDSDFWADWRGAYEGGYYYIENNLRKFSERETDDDFQERIRVSPTPTYAKSAVNDIRNAIFQRMRDIIRKDGSRDYKKAVAGEDGGVDMRGTSMNAFIGMDILTELLVMGRVGIYVDMPLSSGNTLADSAGKRPYLYRYKVEDILSWTCAKPDDPAEFQALLLRDTGIDYSTNEITTIELPCGEYERYRLLWVDPESGFVNVQFYDCDGNPLDSDGYKQSVPTPTVLELTRIPFVMVDIGDSLLKDVINHQAALLNLTSSDVAYALKANFPFYTEQQDMRAIGDHLKGGVNPDGTAMSGGQRAASKEITAGVTHGRAYDLKTDRPGFIHPSSEPLKASLGLQEKLEDDIRKLVNLAVQNKIGTRVTSAEAAKLSDQGLEAGLAYIGLVLENAERRLAVYWAGYESRQKSKQQIATIKYPDRYSLKTDADRVSEAQKLSELMFTVPGRTVKKELSKDIVTALLSGKISTDAMDKIYAEIDNAKYATSDPKIIIPAKEGGLCGDKTASMALGFEENEYKVARVDHIDRVTRIALAQSKVKADSDIENPGARGVDDLADSPAGAGRDERAQATDTTLSDTTKSPVRGPGK